jgi:ELWxxDGT repeat protein
MSSRSIHSTIRPLGRAQAAARTPRRRPKFPTAHCRMTLEPLEDRRVLSVDLELLKDINTTSFPLSSGSGQVVDVGGIAFLVASTSAEGAELWRSDGTLEGTTLVKDLRFFLLVPLTGQAGFGKAMEPRRWISSRHLPANQRYRTPSDRGRAAKLRSFPFDTLHGEVTDPIWMRNAE